MGDKSQPSPDRPIVVCERCFLAGDAYGAKFPIGWRILPKRWTGTHQARQDRLRHQLPNNIAAVGLCYGCNNDTERVGYGLGIVAGIAILWKPTGWALSALGATSFEPGPAVVLFVLAGCVLAYLVALLALISLIVFLVRPISDAVRGHTTANRLYQHMSLVGGSRWDWPLSAQRRLDAEEAARAAADALFEARYPNLPLLD